MLADVTGKLTWTVNNDIPTLKNTPVTENEKKDVTHQS